MALICAEAFAVDSPEFTYLQGKIAAYENKLQECMRLGRNADLPSPDAITLMHEVKPAAFTPARWELQQLYQSLPAEMREEMEEVEALQRPFNALLIREHLYN